MKTIEIIDYLEEMLDDASAQFELAKDTDAQAALIHHIKSSTIQQILEKISACEKRYSELSMSERQKTFEIWKPLYLDEEFYPYYTFEEYDAEQLDLDLTFDAKTLECLG